MWSGRLVLTHGLETTQNAVTWTFVSNQSLIHRPREHIAVLKWNLADRSRFDMPNPGSCEASSDKPKYHLPRRANQWSMRCLADLSGALDVRTAFRPRRDFQAQRRFQKKLRQTDRCLPVFVLDQCRAGPLFPLERLFVRSGLRRANLAEEARPCLIAVSAVRAWRPISR